MAKTYSVDQLINKKITLQRPVKVYRNPYTTTPLYTNRAGQSLGTVYSWVTNKKTGDVWLMFYDASNKPYYVNTKDLVGAVDTKELKQEGAKTTTEIYREEQKKANPVEFYIKQYGPWLLGGIAAIVLLKKL